MKLFVQVWMEIDPTLTFQIDRRTKQPQAKPGDQLERISPLGRVAIDQALKIQKQVGLHCSVAAFAVGPNHEIALRHALAAGAQKAIQFDYSQPYSIMTRPLAQWFTKQQATLIIANRIAGPLAYHLDWGHVAGIDGIEIQGDTISAIRHLGRGQRERVNGTLPWVVRLQEFSVSPKYVSVARQDHFSNAPIEKLALSSLEGLSVETGPLALARPRTKGIPKRVSTSSSGANRLAALLGNSQAASKSSSNNEPSLRTPPEMAEEFIRYLNHHDLI